MCFHLSQAYFQPANSHFKYESRTELKHTQKSHIKDRNNSSGDMWEEYFIHLTCHNFLLQSSPCWKIQLKYILYKGLVFKFNLSMCRAEVFTVFYVEVDTEEETRPVCNYCGSSYSWETFISYWCGKTLHVRLLFHLRFGNSL